MLKLKAATHSLEGLTNLQNTMLNNGLQCPDSGVRQNTGGRGTEWSLILSFRYLQVHVGTTDKFKRPLSGRLKYLKLIFNDSIKAIAPQDRTVWLICTNNVHVCTTIYQTRPTWDLNRNSLSE